MDHSTRNNDYSYNDEVFIILRLFSPKSQIHFYFLSEYEQTIFQGTRVSTSFQCLCMKIDVCNQPLNGCSD